MPLRVVLAEDHVIVREGFRALLEREGFQVLGEASNGHEAIHLCRQLTPDVAVLDVSMPSLNGIDAAKEIRRESPRTKIVLLTMHTEERFVLESLRAGITGYVLKSRGGSELVHAIQEVAKGGFYLSPGVSRTVVDAYLSHMEVPIDPLSDRERQVLQLVAEGNTTKQIAAVLGISTHTAESHRAKIMEKLGIHDTAGLVVYAIRNGLIQT
jgi:two-component system, NarL family, response regulator NreC